jgi:hypothetical protein
MTKWGLGGEFFFRWPKGKTTRNIFLWILFFKYA